LTPARSLLSVAVITALAALASAQTTSKVPRMPDGKPDLQGTYDLATLTSVERRPGLPLVLSDEQAARLEQHDARVVRMNQPHLPRTIRSWMGDSVGHWDGDTTRK
jgi:hypothetical protein